MKILITASLGFNFTGSYKKKRERVRMVSEKWDYFLISLISLDTKFG